MGLAADFRAGIDELWAEFDELLFDITLNHVTQVREHDPFHRDYEQSGAQPTTVKAVEESFKEYQIGRGNIESGDIKYFIRAYEVDDVSLIDSVTIGGVEWEIVSYEPIQKGMLIKLHLRRGG